MKKITIAIAGLFALTFFATATNAATCGAKFMKDPCPIDGYSIVDTERFVRGSHNRMYDIHHFGEVKKQTHRKRFRSKKTYRKRAHHRKVYHRKTRLKKRYKFVRRCRTVKVRL